MIVVFVGVFVYIDFTYLLKAQVKEISSTKAKVEKLQLDINNVKRDVSMMKQDLNREKTPVEVKKIYSEGELLSLLENISLLARNNAVRVSQINPQKGNRAQKAGQAQSAYLSVLIRLDLTCNYHSLGAFISDLENSDFAVSTEEIRITPDFSGGQKEKVLLTLKTYVKI